MREGTGGVNSALETISAAATAIASAETRIPQAAAQKTRWGSCWDMYWCFGSQKHTKRISHAVAVETSIPVSESPVVENYSRTPAAAVTAVTLPLPFAAPPSSPVSFPQSESSSATLSPVGITSISSVSGGIYSPVERPAMFRVGPYAHETQLVSPPVFSAFTTEPSTAPFTPPAESVHVTTPSSPEVPFARLLDPTYEAGNAGKRSYSSYPGSPLAGRLLTSASFPTAQSMDSTRSSRFLADYRVPDVGEDETVHDCRVSFEIFCEEVVRSAGRDPSLLARAVCASLENRVAGDDDDNEDYTAAKEAKEFNFGNTEGESGRPSISSYWWANTKGPPSS